MAGIKLLEKKPEHLNFVINELLKPDIRAAMFDDMWGMNDIAIMLYDPITLVYGIFEKGHPVPVGCIIVENLRPFRGCEIHAAIFKSENRNGKRIQAIAKLIKGDLMLKWNVHYAQARVMATNEITKHLLEKLGFTKVGTKPGNIVSGGKYVDVDEYYLVLNGDRLLDIEVPIPKKEEASNGRQD